LLAACGAAWIHNQLQVAAVGCGAFHYVAPKGAVLLLARPEQVVQAVRLRPAVDAVGNPQEDNIVSCWH